MRCISKGLREDCLREIPDIGDYTNNEFDREHNSNIRPDASQMVLRISCTRLSQRCGL